MTRPFSASAPATNAAALGAIATLFGVIASGPLAIVALSVLDPQPAWTDAASFAQHYHPIQVLPYLGGFFLVGGFVLLVASLQALAGPLHKAQATAALVFTTVYATLVFLNYVLQTTWIPYAAAHFTPADAALVTLFSMANPASLAWAIEMWGYAFVGLATWLLAPVMAERPGGRLAASAFVANGVVSIAGGFWTALRPGWVMTPPGTVAFAGWNLLVVVMLVLAVVSLKRRSEPKPHGDDGLRLAGAH